MYYSTYRFTLDLQKHRSQMAIAVFKNDTAVKLYISLTDGGKPYFIEDNSSAIFYGKRADDVPLVHMCKISEGNTEIIYEFENTTACVEGIVYAQIRLYGADQKLITAPEFTIVVDEKVVSDDAIEEEMGSPLSAFDAIFTSENNREAAELERSDAEAQRLYNEGMRIEAEEKRCLDETARNEKETLRVANETQRNNAEITRNSNETQRQAEEAQRQANEKVREAKLITLYRLKGTIATYDSLLDIQDAIEGDVYELQEEVVFDDAVYVEGTNFAYTADKTWKPLANKFDTSAFIKKSDAEKLMPKPATTINNNEFLMWNATDKTIKGSGKFNGSFVEAKDNSSSATMKVYGILQNSKEQALFPVKSGYEGHEDYNCIPLRFQASSTHPGTFEISHPIMDSSARGYSAKHPMTVGTAEERYSPINHSHDEYAPSDHGHSGVYAPSSHSHDEYASSSHSHSEYAPTNHGHSGFASYGHTHSEYVTTTVFEDFKKTLDSSGGSTEDDTSGDSTTTPITIKSFSISPSTAKTGETVSNVTCTWSLSKTPSSLKLNGTSITKTLLTKTLTGSYTSNTTFTLTATDADGNTVTTSKTLTFYTEDDETTYYVYYGSVAEPSSYTSSFVEGLDNKVQKDVDEIDEQINVTVNSGEYFYYCLPADWAAPTFVFNNFTVKFKLVSTVVVDSISYSIYRTPYGSYGNIDITVS